MVQTLRGIVGGHAPGSVVSGTSSLGAEQTGLARDQYLRQLTVRRVSYFLMTTVKGGAARPQKERSPEFRFLPQAAAEGDRLGLFAWTNRSSILDD